MFKCCHACCFFARVAICTQRSKTAAQYSIKAKDLALRACLPVYQGLARGFKLLKVH